MNDLLTTQGYVEASGFIANMPVGERKTDLNRSHLSSQRMPCIEMRVMVTSMPYFVHPSASISFENMEKVRTF